MSRDLDMALHIVRKRREEGGSTTTESVAPVPKFHVGPIHSSVAGRTDHLPITVESGSYVLPSETVSASGQNNTIAGFKTLRRTFGGAPYGQSGKPYNQTTGVYGSPAPRAAGGRTKAAGIMFLSPEGEILLLRRAGADHHGEWGLPAGHIEKGETAQEAARRETREETGYDHEGGLSPLMRSAPTDNVDFASFVAHSDRFKAKLNHEHDDAKWVKPEEAEKLKLHPGVRKALDRLRSRKAAGGASTGVPIVAAGGEHVLSPSQVRQVGGGDLDVGHRVLDKFVMRVRREHIQTLKHLQPPAKN